MSASTIAETLGVPLEQVEPVVTQYYAERRERMMARFKPAPQLVIPVIVVPSQPSAVQLRQEAREREREQLRAERAAKRAEKQAEVEAARAAKRAARHKPAKVPKAVGAKYLPSVEQIAVACEAIQASWTEGERVTRWLRAHSVDGITGLVSDTFGVELSVVAVRDMVAAA